MIHNCEYLSPTRRVIGSDALDKIGPKLKEDGAHKVLIHYGGGDYLYHGLLDRVKKSLADSGLEYVDFPGVKPNPRLSKALEGAEFAKANGVDYILSVGGGSAVDSAKAISLGMSYEGDLWDLWKKADTLAPDVVLTPVAGVIVYPATGAEAGSSSVNIPILVAGRMNDPYQSEKAIAEGMADCVVMARQSLADPHYPKKLEMGKPKEIRPCISCNEACVGRLYSVGCAAGCAVNPSAMHELEYSMAKTMEPKKVMVVGGGVGGMEAARVAKERGHDVELYERDAVLSGNQIAAGMHDFKQDIRRLNEWYHRQIDELEIPVHFNCDVTPEFIKEKHPDAVILAVGGTALMPKSIPGIDHPKSVCCTDALLGKREVGDTVVIVGGGMVGCEIALDYAMKGKKVSIVEALPDIISAGGGAPWMNAMYMKKALEKYKVDIYTSSKLASIDDEGAHIVAADDETKCSTLAADSVVVAIGFRPNPSMAKELLGEGMEVYEVKHANGIGNVMGAVWSAYEIARSL